MSKISLKKEARIKEDILRLLYDKYPEFHYTSVVSYETLRNNEFILRLLNELTKEGLVSFIDEKGGRGIRKKWCLKKEVFEKYKELLP
ncbi:hypothetical protein HYT57_02315 [Candidatus Woesearchaeota archaeon]|nr:hypothetical protein [Candidatus Woesearchaeota archaeon]